jgi:suppressor of fused-like protein
VETWSADGFVEEYAKSDPLLLTQLSRPSRMSDADFSSRVSTRAQQEGSTTPAILVDVFWEDTGTELVIELPGERQAQKLLNALHGRLPFGRELTLVSRKCPPIRFRPAAQFDINWSPQGLVIDGNLDERNVARIVSFVRPNAPGAVVRLPLNG